MPRDSATELSDLAVDLVAKANQLSGQIQWTVRDSIGDLVRSMNCYYSNLIEGHNTHPRDIDAAIGDQYSTDPQRKALQQEAIAHIEVQRLIDSGEDPQVSPMSAEYIRWLHYEFCRRLPPAMLWVEHPVTGTRVRVEPGEFRTGDVEVGRHVPPPPGVSPEARASDSRPRPAGRGLRTAAGNVCPARGGRSRRPRPGRPVASGPTARRRGRPPATGPAP